MALTIPSLSLSRSETLTEMAEAAIRQALMSGVFLPGQTITMRALATSLGVSVTPAKDAMSRLVAERILQTGPRRSAVVPLLSKESIREIYVIRLSLETTAAERGAMNSGIKDVKSLSDIAKRLADAMKEGDYKAVLRYNKDFHFFLYEKSEMPILVGMIEGLWLRLGPSMNLLYSQQPKTLQERAGVGYHDELIEAFRKGDTEGVKRAIDLDLSAGRDRLEEATSYWEIARPLRDAIPGISLA